MKELNKGKLSSVSDFDDHVRSKIWGYNDWKELYHESSSVHVLEHIEAPFMIIYASDDPISLQCDYPRQLLLKNPYGILIESEYGSHCGFHHS